MLKKFGYDMLPVLAGVLIALIINNYQQTLADRKFTRDILERISSENSQNIHNIETLLVKQRRTIDTLKYYEDSTQYSIYDLVQKVNGLSTPDMLNNGSQFVFRSSQNLVDVETLMKLAAIQEAMESYDISVQFIINALYSDIYFTEKQKKARLVLMLSDLMNYERNILLLSREFNDMVSAKESR